MRLAFVAVALACAALASTARADDRDAARVALGRRLFLDPTVGRRGRQSCAACHVPAHGFSDTRARFADDDDGPPSARHAPSLLDLPAGPLGWSGAYDGVRDAVFDRVAEPADAREAAALRFAALVERERAAGLAIDEESAKRRCVSFLVGHDPLEPDADARMAVERDVPRVPTARRLADDGRYAAGFRAAFGDEAVTTDRVTDALAAYVSSLRSGENDFDRSPAGHADALSEPARRGLELFVGKAGCAACHVVGEGRAPLTDGSFHAVLPIRDLGRFRTTFLVADRGAFRTPSLRDVARRGPYFHDGSAATLPDAVRAHLPDGAKPAERSDAETDDLVAFLSALTGDVRPGFETPQTPSPLAVHVADLDGSPRAGLVVRATPFGEPIADGPDAAGVFEATTDEHGDALVSRPAWTHVVLEAAGVELGLSRPVPDSAVSFAVLATPLDRVSVRVRGGRAPVAAALTIQRSGGDGVWCADATNFAHRLVFVRALADDEALFVGAKPGFSYVGPMTIALGPVGGVRELDVRGGASETLDLSLAESDDGRLDPGSPAGRKLLGLVFVKGR